MYKYKTRQLATPPTISSENISRYWYDDSAFKTGFLNSLSSLFEGGEKFFMKSLNYYTPQYPEYKKEVLDFCREEAMHSKTHSKLNELIDEEYGNTLLQDFEKQANILLTKIYSKLTPELNLIVTETLEHITYHLCETILERQDVVDTTYSDAKEVFLYHCLDETGESHSSVASRIANRAINRWYYKLARKYSITPISFILLLVLFYQLLIIYKVNKDIRIREIIKGVSDLFGLNGWVREAIMCAISTWQTEEK